MIDYQALASALVGAMQQAGVVGNVSIVEEKISSLPSPAEDTEKTMQQAEQAAPYSDGQTQREEPIIDESAEVKIARAYEAITVESRPAGEQTYLCARTGAARRCGARRVVSDCAEKKHFILVLMKVRTKMNRVFYGRRHNDGL